MNYALSPEQIKYMSSLSQYFDGMNCYKIEEMANIITGKSCISLRFLEWFVKEYNKSDISWSPIIGDYDIYVNYCKNKKNKRVEFFDPYCRGPSVDCEYDYEDNDSRAFKTSISQLNFFKWLYENNIMNYIEENYYEICQEWNKAVQ